MVLGTNHTPPTVQNVAEEILTERQLSALQNVHREFYTAPIHMSYLRPKEFRAIQNEHHNEPENVPRHGWTTQQEINTMVDTALEQSNHIEPLYTGVAAFDYVDQPRCAVVATNLTIRNIHENDANFNGVDITYRALNEIEDENTEIESGRGRVTIKFNHYINSNRDETTRIDLFKEALRSLL